MAKSKTTRKYLIASASTALVAAAVAPAVGAASEFPDVPSTNFYYDAIQSLSNQGVVTGYPDGSFHIGKSVTRAEASKMVSEIRGLKKTSPAAPFKDLKSGAWYNEYINALYNEGLIEGLPGGTFGPNQTLTRAQFAKMVVDAYDLKLENDVKLPFKDVKDNAWYTPYIKTLYANKLITGVSADTFAPGNNIKRGDFALLLYRANGDLSAEPVIKQISALDDIKIEEGTEAKLPETVKVMMSDDTTKDVPVKWDTSKLDTAKPGTYKLTGTVEGTDLTANVNVVVNAVDLRVVGVDGLNATQVEVKFNKAVDKSSLFTDGNSGAFKATGDTTVVALKSLDGNNSGNLTGMLSKDGKTLTVTAANPLSKRYDVIVNNLKAADGKGFTNYNEMVTLAADNTPPAILKTERVTASSFKVLFSEPIKSLGTVTYKLTDGTTVAGSGNGVTNNFTAGATEVTFTIGSDVAANKDVVATFVGTQDQAGNLISPNPSTVTFQKGDKDGVPPTVGNITQTGATTFAVKFSEELIAAPTISINGTDVAAPSVAKDVNDPTIYNVTAPDVLDGVATVAVKSFTDLSGEAGKDFSKVVTFVKDTAAPKVTNSKVVRDSANGKEYLELTFDKDVTVKDSSTVSAAGTYVDNYVTKNFAAQSAPVLVSNTNDKKLVRVDLSTLLANQNAENASYSLNLTFSNLASTANVDAGNSSVTFTRGKDSTPDTGAVVGISKVVQGADNNKVEVTFDKAVDGESATNPNNYRIDGATVSSVTLNPAAGGTQVAVVNLQPGTNTFTGVRNINISGIKANGSSNVMEPYFTNSVPLNENVAPTVTNARLSATNQITLTFSEAVTNDAGVDFNLYAGNTDTGKTVTFTTAAAGAAQSTLTATLSGNVTDEELNKGLSLKPASTIDIKDVAGNPLSVPDNGIGVTR